MTIRDYLLKKPHLPASDEPDCTKLIELVKQINASMTEKERRKQQLLLNPDVSHKSAKSPTGPNR